MAMCPFFNHQSSTMETFVRDRLMDHIEITTQSCKSCKKDTLTLYWLLIVQISKADGVLDWKIFRNFIFLMPISIFMSTNLLCRMYGYGIKTTCMVWSIFRLMIKTQFKYQSFLRIMQRVIHTLENPATFSMNLY